MPEAYLTIDDSPSPRTHQLLDFLDNRGLQAMFFSRGDFMEDHPVTTVDIIKAGHILANHLYSHRPSSDLGYQKVIEEIKKTERIITQAYVDAGTEKSGKYLRFPYLDRGDGTKTEQKMHDLVKSVQNGASDPFMTSSLTQELQKYLKDNGYTQPFLGVTHPLYKVNEIRNASDCLLTFTSYDWMLSPRHKGKAQYQTVSDLQNIIDTDDYLLQEGGVNIVLFHDDREGIINETCALIDHMLDRGLTFREYQT